MRAQWLQGVAAVAAIAALARAAPRPDPEGQPAETAKPAGTSPIESADVPTWRPSPPRFAVTPFENHTSGKTLDWIVAEAPFEIAEKTEAQLALEPTGGPLHVGGAQIPADEPSVAAFGARENVPWVITGWFDKPTPVDLRLDLVLWKVEKGSAKIAAQAQKSGPPSTYHQLLGTALAEIWAKVGVTTAQPERLSRALSNDYAVFLFGHGLAHLTGAAGTVDLKLAEHELERSVIMDPKLYEAQRVLGETYVLIAPADPKANAKAAAKLNYANDLAPDDLASLRGAAAVAFAAGKHELATELFRRLVTKKPWDLDARYHLGSAMWSLGDARGAERQLVQVTAQQPNHLDARRVLVLIHASRSDTKLLVAELEAIAQRAPNDLEIKADLATGYGALGKWDKAIAELEAIGAARAPDLALLVRIGDAHRRLGQLDIALGWYGKAFQVAPQSSFAGFAAAQALFDAGKLADAQKAYTNLQKYKSDIPAAEQALGAIAFIQNRNDDAAWYLRRATRDAPRSLPTWQALIAAELARKDSETALKDLERALGAWPDDTQLHYLAGVAHAFEGETAEARTELVRVLAVQPGHAGASSGLAALDANGAVGLLFVPQLVRPWGDGDALQAALDRYGVVAAAMATARITYQAQILDLLGNVGVGPHARVAAGSVHVCPIGKQAPLWSVAQQQLAGYERLGVDLEATYRFIVRHREVGATAGLLPAARTQAAAVEKAFRTALADAGELRAELSRGVTPELRAAGCSDRLLAAAVADPAHYHVIEDDKPETMPTTAPPRARPRVTFYVDNANCPDSVDVWIDGAQIGQVAPGRRSALVSDGGARTLCLLVPGGAQCGDRGTGRQVYLHDGWAVTMHCPK